MNQDQKDAIERWFDTLGAPSSVRPALMKKFRKLNMSAEEINADMVAKFERRKVENEKS